MTPQLDMIKANTARRAQARKDGRETYAKAQVTDRVACVRCDSLLTEVELYRLGLRKCLCGCPGGYWLLLSDGWEWVNAGD